MIFEAKEFELNGRNILLRSGTVEDAEVVLEVYKQVCGESRFLSRGSDEVTETVEDEAKMINDYIESEDSMLILAFVDGEYAGNCSFSGGKRKRARHRAGIGIGILDKYTNFGLGRLMLENLIDKIEELGYEQIELKVIDSNDRARHLYRSLGFKEFGRIPNYDKYEDGTYSDIIEMVKEVPR
jgi:ribosomal protein S18 acetylase RimI-like enzyme